MARLPTAAGYAAAGGHEYLIVSAIQQLQQTIQQYDSAKQTAISATSQAAKYQAVAQITAQQDSVAFGLGWVARKGAELVGSPTLETMQVAAQHAANIETFYKSKMELDVQKASLGGQEAVAGLGLLGLEKGILPSRIIELQASESEKSVKASAAEQLKLLAAERKSSLGTIKSNPLLTGEQEKSQIEDVEAQYKIDKGKIDADVAHAVETANQQRRAAKVQAREEAVRNTIAQQSTIIAAALQGGAGGEDAAFRIGQKQVMEAQQEKEARGESTAGETAALGAGQKTDKLQREREIAQQTKDITSEGQEAILPTEGRFYDARREAFDRASQDKLLAARAFGQKEIDETRKTIEAQRKLMEEEISHEIQVRQAASSLTVERSEDRSKENTLRARGELYAADEQAYKASWDRKILAADDAVIAERDPIEKANRRKERDALDAERKTDEARRNYLKPGGERDLAIRGEQVEDTKLQARGQYQTEQMKETVDKANRAFTDAASNTPLQRSIAEQAKADIEKQEFDIKRRSLGQLGRSSRHSFEMGADNMKPLEDLNDVMKRGNEILDSIDKYLKMQVAKTTP